jgi:CheY-like chemotaxis protein
MKKERDFKILIVDDEPEVREILSRQIPRKLKAQVAEAGDGKEAVKRTRTFRPDLILLDIRLPGDFWGWQVVEEVRKFDSTVKFIIITGMSMIPEEYKELVHDHVAAFVFKPLLIDEVLRSVVEVLGTSSKRKEVLTMPVERQRGRPEAREIVHELVNAHSRIRLKCESFLLNYEEGCFKDRSDAELLSESIGIMKKTIMAIDHAAIAVERIRQL